MKSTRTDLFTFHFTDPVLRMGQATCLEMMVLLALTYRKREKNTKIYSFGGDENTLVPVKLTADMTFEKALNHCESLLVSVDHLSVPLRRF